MPDRLTFAAPVEIRAAAAGKRPTFRVLAYSGEARNLAGFCHPVVADLDGKTLHRPDLPILLGHDESQRVGHAAEVKRTAAGIEVAGVVTGDDGAAA